MLRLIRVPTLDMDDATLLACVDAITVGLDLTDRPRQGAAKADGRPWTRAKAFMGSGSHGTFVAVGGRAGPGRHGHSI